MTLTDSEIDTLLEKEYPGRFYARLLDMRDQMKMELAKESSDYYKAQYRILIKGLIDLTETYEYYCHGEWNPKTKKHEN